jgi:sugar/nucleoside kinase (ribokinase family)
MPQSLDVLCLGILVADTLDKPIARLPAWGTLELTEHAELQPGGCAPDTSISLAPTGFRVGAMGKLGEDGFGDYVLRGLKSLEAYLIRLRAPHPDRLMPLPPLDSVA